MYSTACAIEENRLGMGDAIRRLLEYRHAMHIGELCLRLGEAEGRIREVLAGLVERGEVERLRPIDYPLADHDCFRLADRQSAAVADVRGGNIWIGPGYGKAGYD